MDTNMENHRESSQPKRITKSMPSDRRKKAIIRRSIAIGAAAVIIAFAAGVITLMATVPKDVIATGVYADNINLSGMTMEEAEKAIAEHSFFDIDKITVTAEGQSYDIPTKDIQLSVDAAKTAEKAFAIGKSSNKLADAKDALIMRFSNKKAELVPMINEEALNNSLYEFGKQIYGELQEHSFEIGDEYVTVTPGKTGASTDHTQAHDKILSAISDGKYDNIAITINKQSPKNFDLESLCNTVRVEPKNAEYKTSSKSVEVVDHVVGVEVDRADAEGKVSDIKEGGEPVKIKINKTMPEITKGTLESKLFNTTLASYSTKYSAANKNRSANVALAASKMNGTVLGPGDTFSYNEVVGKRTTANGFKNAPVYENGKSVDGIGGGVCQVSTTLYSAVLYADLKIVSRQNHSLTVSYVPLGQDATVVDGSIDFKFQNNTNYPIKIVSSAGGGTISVSIVGTERDKKHTVKLEHKTVSTISPTTKETKNSSLPAGSTKVVSSGKTGYVVESTKIVYEDGEEISRTSLGKSTYKMVQKEVEVGTAAATQTAAPATAAPAQPAAEQPEVNAPSQSENTNQTTAKQPLTEKLPIENKPETKAEQPETNANPIGENTAPKLDTSGNAKKNQATN